MMYDIGIESEPDLLPVSSSKIAVEDFDCVLCCRTLYRPVVSNYSSSFNVETLKNYNYR